MILGFDWEGVGELGWERLRRYPWASLGYGLVG